MKFDIVSSCLWMLMGLSVSAGQIPVELCRFNDLCVFRKTTPAQAETNVVIARDLDNVYVMVECREPLEVTTVPPEDGYGVWKSDNLELFFGSLGEHPWFRHLVVGASGARFSIYAELTDWSAKTVVGKDGWQAFVTIPISTLGPCQDDLRFNILRERKKGGELQTWSNIITGHDVDLYKKIPFALPDNYAIHGPWIFSPHTTSVGIGWESNESTATILEYREAGTKEFKVYAEPAENGILRKNRKLHKVWLTNLKPDTEYDFKVGGATGSFRTLKDQSADFTTFVTSDLHERPALLTKILRRPDLQNADFAILLGDMITSAWHKVAFYDAFLDTTVKNWPKPFVYPRGNHEFRGRDAALYFDMFGSQDNKGYYAFQHGGVFFIVIDSEGEFLPGTWAEYNQEVGEFLLRTANTPEFKNADFRVVLGHVAPLSTTEDGRVTAALLKKLPPKSIDLFIGGHKHVYAYVPANSKTVQSITDRFNGKPSYELDFPVLAGDLAGIIKIERRGNQLHITAQSNQDKVFSSFVDLLKPL